MLRVDRVLTTVQLERRGLIRAADWLGLPRVTYTCRTRVTQSDSGVDLTFVAEDEVWLQNSPRDLMHWAGLGEARSQLGRVRLDLSAHRWQHVDLGGRLRSSLPDAELLGPAGQRNWDGAAEFDAGYSPVKVAVKLEAAAVAGYRLLIWASSIHSRTITIPEQARELHRLGLLPGLAGVIVLFVDFWSPGSPYDDRSRCHKPMHAVVRFTDVASASRVGGRVRNPGPAGTP
ncbi:hypothetical protein [Deinococcus sp. UYEF24]